MLRNALPFKISVVSLPNNLINELFLDFTKQKSRNSSIEQDNVSYTRNMTIDTIPIELHLRVISTKEQETKKRLRAYQGSLGLFYIFEKGNFESFKKLMKDFLKFKDFYRSMNSNPIFLGLNNHSNPENMDTIDQEVKKYKVKYREVDVSDNNSFEHFLRKFILNSESFQATVQGSCDINS
ncbi:MAG: hypothetical protein ACW990_19460 [Promethearchaeota archaeon]|jgi:hypothetical protein